MKRIHIEPTVELSGFNNLTKCLSFNLYDFCAARNERERKAYVQYVSERFRADKVSEVLTGICDIIEAKVLATSDQDYEPWGASSLVLMSDLKGGGGPASHGRSEPEVFKGQSRHLDKSHICAHTYPDFTDGGRICSFRIDIDIATCGEISPLKALNYMFDHFDSDVVVIDYVVRGFTRDAEGKRVYMDHEMRGIQDFIHADLLKDYHCVDLAMQSENIWQTKMLRTRQEVNEYFLDPIDPEDPEVKEHMREINREMRGILHMWPE